MSCQNGDGQGSMDAIPKEFAVGIPGPGTDRDLDGLLVRIHLTREAEFLYTSIITLPTSLEEGIVGIQQMRLDIVILIETSR